MGQEFILWLAKGAVETTLMVSLPVLLLSLVVGIIISIFQAVTQIQEMTITFVPKITVTFIGLLLFGTWMMQKLTGFTEEIFRNFPYWIR